MKRAQGFWTEVDGQPVQLLGDPDMDDETAAALAELVRCAIRAIENGTLGQGKSMAIDAKIKAMQVDGENLILELEPRVNVSGHPSLAGQERLTVLNFQYKPDVGDEIWGGSGQVQIVRKNGRPTMHYQRVGYTELREDHDAPFRSPTSPRYG